MTLIVDLLVIIKIKIILSACRVRARLRCTLLPQKETKLW
jgi:hypothetical protein